MSLIFADSSTDAIDCGSAASLDDQTAMTICTWIKPTNNSNSYRNWGGKGSKFVLFRRGVDGTRLAATISGTGTNLVTDINTALITTGWNFIAFAMSLGVSQAAYWGTTNTAVTDQTRAGGAVGGLPIITNAADNFTIGSNQGDAATSAAPYTIGLFSLWNRVLSLAEIQEQQFNPYPSSGCVLFIVPGYNGRDTQRDWSGSGNHGTVTGAGEGEPVPVRLHFSEAHNRYRQSGAGRHK